MSRRETAVWKVSQGPRQEGKSTFDLPVPTSNTRKKKVPGTHIGKPEVWGRNAGTPPTKLPQSSQFPKKNSAPRTETYTQALDRDLPTHPLPPGFFELKRSLTQGGGGVHWTRGEWEEGQAFAFAGWRSPGPGRGQGHRQLGGLQAGAGVDLPQHLLLPVHPPDAERGEAALGERPGGRAQLADKEKTQVRTRVL